MVAGDDIGIRKGAGGKLTKRSLRTTVRSTPYDRPTTRGKKTDGWFSKLLVQPASRILPSFFSSSSSKHRQQDSPESLPVAVEQEDCETVSSLISDLQNQFFELREPDASAKKPKVDFKGDELVKDQLGDTCADCGIAEVKQRLRQKKFSRDETNRLIELLQLRTIDLPKDDRCATGFTVETAAGTPSQKNLRASTKEEYGVQSEHWMARKTSESFQVPACGISSSPIDIAKAYMEARTSTSDYDSQGSRMTERSSYCGATNTSKSSFTTEFTSAVNSPICWPGAVVQCEQAYFTPQGGRIGPRPRTPYSGAIFSKSNSKPTKRTNFTLNDGIATVGPQYHVHQKNIARTASRGGDLEHGSPKHGELGSSKDGFWKYLSTDLDVGGSRFACSVDVHPQSSGMARKILEHLDRTVSSPKEKSLELKQGVARIKTPVRSAFLVVDGQDEGPVKISDVHQPGTTLGRDMAAIGSVDAHKVLSGPSVAMPTERLESSDTGSCFTFPTMRASSSFLESPPTPTMASPLVAAKTVDSTEGSIPLFNFGSASSENRLAFSFGFSPITDDTAPNFKFGSVEKCNISFKSIVKDVICCSKSLVL